MTQRVLTGLIRSFQFSRITGSSREKFLNVEFQICENSRQRGDSLVVEDESRATNKVLAFSKRGQRLRTVVTISLFRPYVETVPSIGNFSPSECCSVFRVENVECPEASLNIPEARSPGRAVNSRQRSPVDRSHNSSLRRLPTTSNSRFTRTRPLNVLGDVYRSRFVLRVILI